MKSKELLTLARQVLTLPTAPYHEHRVREFVMAYCRELGLRVELDCVGNVIAKCQGSRSQSRSQSTRGTTPLVFVAHMDHPGFEALGGDRAEFLGGVPKELFKGAHVRFYSSSECGGSTPPFPHGKQQGCVKPQHSIGRATISRVDGLQWSRRKLVRLKADSRIHPGDFGLWDVPAFRVADGKLCAAAIDDVLGVVVVLATLAESVRKKSRTAVWGAFTRAEEVGFHGAIELAKARRVPRHALIVSVEMSRERPGAKIGSGPVVRVGDRMSTFDPQGTSFLDQVAQRCHERQSTFRYQRALMDGGTCEATAFAVFGYRVGGLCLPLGNYHNIGRDGKIRAEYVSVRDLERLVQLTVETAVQWRNFAAVAARLQQRVARIRSEAPRELRG